MISTRQVSLILGALMLGTGTNVVSGQSASRHCASEECACEEALRQNTVEAIEDFLRKYPQSTSKGDTACAALAVPPLDEGLDLDSQSHDDGGTTVEPVIPSEG